MIDWILCVNQYGEDSVHYNLRQENDVFIKETDNIDFLVEVSGDYRDELKNISVIIGDIPCNLEKTKITDDVTVFKNTYDKQHEKVYFRNYFGESEIILINEDDGAILLSANINILATQRNAKVAKEMLNYVSDNLDNSAQNCFSRSKKGASIEKSKEMALSKVELIKKVTEHLIQYTNLFHRDNKKVITNDIEWKVNGKPVGPESIYLALNHLDKCQPSEIQIANLIFMSRGYRFDEIPEEVSIQDTNTYENQVINNFLFRAEDYLRSILIDINNKGKIKKSIVKHEGFVRFDHVVSSLYDSILKYKKIEFQSLINSISNLRRFYLKIIPSSYTKYQPIKLTRFVQKKSHYYVAFQDIFKFENAPGPNFNGNQILMGLKNLSIIYEFVTLLTTVKTLGQFTNAKEIEFDYREYEQSYGFEGKSVDKPIGSINNYFIIKNADYKIEVFYEPRIYQYSKFSKPFDIVNTSNRSNSAKYGAHYYSPDLLIRAISAKWDEPLVMVFDAKYKDVKTVKKYDLDGLAKKYLYSLHQLGSDYELKSSPIKMMLALFSHKEEGSQHFWSKAIHQSTGSMPVWPQIGAIHVSHDNQNLITEQINGAFEAMNQAVNKNNTLSLVS